MLQYSLFNKYYTPSGMEIDLSNYYTKSETDNRFQRKLESGINIKTINEQSLLGSGNITIGGGGGSYTSGDGIDITNDVISVNNTIARISELPDMSDYYNKTEIDTSLNNIYQGLVSALDTKQDVLTSNDGIVISPSNVISVDSTIARVSELPDMNDYYDKTEVDNLIPDVSGFATTTYVDTEVTTKQDTLVSGTNIKTINNQSILGSGNIDIGSGTGGNANLNLDIPNQYATISNDTEAMAFDLANEKLIVSKPNEYYKELSLGGSDSVVIDVDNFNMTISEFTNLFFSDKLIYIKDGYLNHLITNKYTWDMLPETVYELSYIEGNNKYTYTWYIADDIYYQGKNISSIGANYEVGRERWYGTYKEDGVVYQVYSKTIKIDSLSSKAGITTYNHGVINIKQILNVYGFGTNGFILNAPRQNIQDNISIYQVSKSSSNPTISIEVGKDRSNMGAYITLVYAKNN